MGDGLEEQDGIVPIYYEGLPWKGHPTRVFARVEYDSEVPLKRVDWKVVVEPIGIERFASYEKVTNVSCCFGCGLQENGSGFQGEVTGYLGDASSACAAL